MDTIRREDFLPVSKSDMAQRGWDSYDFLVITGDAYVDHPSFGPAIISRVLEAEGYRTAILAQPDWRKSSSFTSLGRPRLGVFLSSGNIDSMVAHYTVAKKRRHDDAYSPGNRAGLRPDRAVIVYANKIREVFGDIPLMIGGIWFVQTASHKRWQIFRKKSSNLNAYVHEDIAGMNVVQSFGAEEETREIFGNLTDEHQQSFVDAVRYADMFGPVIDFCWGIGAMMLYLVGVRFLGFEKVSVGLLVAFGTYINMFWNPIMNLSNFYNNLVTNLTAAERIFDILDTKADIVDAADVTELPEVQGRVEFSHVSFTYDKGTPAETKVLSDVSFVVEPGETIALVGPTGAGKTTIVNLISRFYDIEDGVISVDGYDLTKISIESLRRQMGVMTQDNFIFHGTVRENILYGKLDATDEEMIAAAKAVNAHEFIMKMEKGYDTELKEHGAGLSIGQRQLIAFARTMISMPKILILDEATSSIDTHTEILVQKGIEALLSGRTSFVIAHRLSTIQNADRIFVIDQGGILEQGSPAELMKKKGAYYDLYMAQFAGLE